jgi:hypothetical protein
MLISDFIALLEELENVCGDVHVAISSPGGPDRDVYEEARAELTNVSPVVDPQAELLKWECLEEGNTEQIVTIW